MTKENRHELGNTREEYYVGNVFNEFDNYALSINGEKRRVITGPKPSEGSTSKSASEIFAINENTKPKE